MRRDTSALQSMQVESEIRRKVAMIQEREVLIGDQYQQQKQQMESDDESFEMQRPGKKIRIKIVTNRGLQFITAVKPEATVSDLANRALSVYLELVSELYPNTCKKQLTVSAVKQGVFYMPKSEYVANLLSNDEQVEVVIIKAKPKYPHQMFQEQYASKKNRPISPQELPQVQPYPQPKTVCTQQRQVIEERRKKEDALSTAIRLRERALEESKRQKKKEKKKEKWEKKYNQDQGRKQSIVQESSRKQQQKQQIVNQEQEIPESMPRKKTKQDKEEINKSQEKVIPKIMPSPKITFHSEPKIDSPRVNLLNELPKRKPTVELQTPKIQARVRIQSEDIEKGKAPESQGAQIQTIKSPQVNGHKTPQMVSAEIQQLRARDELSNFSLSNKVSEDRRNDSKSKRVGEEESTIKQNIQIKQQLLASSIGVILQSNSDSSKNKITIKSTTLTVQQVPPGQIDKVAPVKKSVVVVQPPSDSDSQQNKNVSFTNNSSTRSKQLDELKSRIKSFAIDSEEEA